MKVFISWSGPRSKAVAQALQKWLRLMIQAAEPWISSEMAKGTKWGPEISDRLEESRVGIICLTRDNLTAPWILFEAGAISKSKDAQVCTFLLDIQPADVEPPLGQFQHTLPTKTDVRRLVGDINAAVHATGGKPISEQDIDKLFETLWPQLESNISAIMAKGKQESPIVREDRELLEEVLEIVRALDRRSVTAANPFTI